MSTHPAAAAQAPRLIETTFQAGDGTRLFHRALVPEGARAAVVVVHGYGDHSGRYVHVLEALARAGFAAHALDYRGHGRAGGLRGYVARFAHYLDDVEACVRRVVESHGGPVLLLGHSLGALVAGLLAVRRPGLPIAALALSGPYVQLRIAPTRFQLFQALVVGRILPFLPVRNPLTTDQLTRDEALRRATDADPLYHHVVTPRWFTESNAAQAQLLAEAPALRLPLLVLQGEEDPVAHPEGARRLFEACGSADKRLQTYPGMLHEVFNETGRERVLQDLVAWLQARAPAAREG